MSRKTRPCKVCGRIINRERRQSFPQGGGTYCSSQCKANKRNATKRRIGKRPKPGPVHRYFIGARPYDPAYYRTQEWQATRDAQLIAHPKCWLCRLPAETAHHTTYERFGAEQDGDLISLCNKCHHLVTALHRSKMVPLERAHFYAAEAMERPGLAKFIARIESEKVA